MGWGDFVDGMKNFGDNITLGVFSGGTDPVAPESLSLLDDTQRPELDAFITKLAPEAQQAITDMLGLKGKTHTVGDVDSASGRFSGSPYNISEFAGNYKGELDEMLSRIAGGSELGNAYRSDADPTTPDVLGGMNITSPYGDDYQNFVQEGVIDPLELATQKQVRDDFSRQGGNAFSLANRRMRNDTNQNFENQRSMINLSAEDKRIQGDMWADELNVSQNDEMRTATLQNELARLEARVKVEGDYASAQNDFEIQNLMAELQREQNISALSNTYLSGYGDLAGIEATSQNNFNNIMSELARADLGADVDMETLKAQNAWNEWNNQFNVSSTMINALLGATGNSTFGISGGMQGEPAMWESVIAKAGGTAGGIGIGKWLTG